MFVILHTLSIDNIVPELRKILKGQVNQASDFDSSRIDVSRTYVNVGYHGQPAWEEVYVDNDLNPTVCILKSLRKDETGFKYIKIDRQVFYFSMIIRTPQSWTNVPFYGQSVKVGNSLNQDLNDLAYSHFYKNNIQYLSDTRTERGEYNYQTAVNSPTLFCNNKVIVLSVSSNHFTCQTAIAPLTYTVGDYHGTPWFEYTWVDRTTTLMPPAILCYSDISDMLSSHSRRVDENAMSILYLSNTYSDSKLFRQNGFNSKTLNSDTDAISMSTNLLYIDSKMSHIPVSSTKKKIVAAPLLFGLTGENSKTIYNISDSAKMWLTDDISASSDNFYRSINVGSYRYRFMKTDTTSNNTILMVE